MQGRAYSKSRNLDQALPGIHNSYLSDPRETTSLFQPRQKEVLGGIRTEFQELLTA